MNLALPVDRQILRPALIAGLALALLLCSFLVIRRMMGALKQPLAGMDFLLAVILSVALVALYRWLFPPDRRSSSLSGMLELRVLPLVCLLMMAGALSLPGTPLWARGIGWLTIVAAEVAWWLPRQSRARPVAADVRRETSNVSLDDELGSEPFLPPGTVQQLTRSEEHGNEVIYGLLRAQFEVGERLQQLHVAFCPPLAEQPDMQAFVAEGPGATVRISQLETFGARLDVQLDVHASRAEEVLVEFSVQAAKSR